MEEVDALFLKWRSDKTGVLEINELERLLRRGASVMKSSIDMGCENKHALRKGAVDKAGSTLLQGFAIDAASELSVAEQLRDALSKAAVRVIDLFREWDDDNSGMVSKEEFRRGMAEMGLKASKDRDGASDSTMLLRASLDGHRLSETLKKKNMNMSNTEQKHSRTISKHQEQPRLCLAMF